MNATFAASGPVNSRRPAYLAAIATGALLILSGCGIPAHRHALPGPALPRSYAWNNGTTWPSPNAGAEPIDAPQPFFPLPLPEEPGTGADGEPNRELDRSAPDAGVASPDASAHRKGLGRLVQLVSFLPGEKPNASGEEKGTADGEEDTGSPPAAGMLVPGHDDAGELPLAPTPEDLRDDSLANTAQLPLRGFFDDPHLLDLVNQALAGNQELRMLAEEVRIASNEAYARSGEYRPFFTLGAGAGVDKPGRYTRAGAVEEQLEVAPGKPFPEPLPDFLVATNVSWELDIWRRLRNAQRAAALRYLGTREGRNYVVTRLVAEIAEKYYELLALDNRLATLERTIAIQRRSLQIAMAKKEAGRGTELAVQRFQAEVQKNESERTIIGQQIVEAENRINFLVGRYPQPVERTDVEFINLTVNALNAGVPSQLLRNRADIRQAEREVAAAGLDVQVARARFYPSLTLTAGLGWNAFSTGYLFTTPESLMYGAAGDLVAPLINKRAIQAAYRSANAAQLQSIYKYQQTVLQAHIEVVNQISKIENLRRSIETKKQQLESLQRSVDVASQLFQNARAEYVEVLLAQRELMEAKMLLIEIKQQQLAAVVNAYQALGGGGF